MVSVVRAPVLASAGVPVPRLWPGRARWACRTFAERHSVRRAQLGERRIQRADQVLEGLGYGLGQAETARALERRQAVARRPPHAYRVDEPGALQVIALKRRADHREGLLGGVGVLLLARGGRAHAGRVAAGPGQGVGPVGRRHGVQRLPAADPGRRCGELCGLLAYRRDRDAAPDLFQAADVLVQAGQGDATALRDRREREPVQARLVRDGGRLGDDPFCGQARARHGYRSLPPSQIPAPAMKASSSTSAGPASTAKPCKSKRYTTPEAAMVTPRAAPRYRSQRGSATAAAAAPARTASASILPPSRRLTVSYSRCTVPGALAAVVCASTMPRQNCVSEISAAASPATMAIRAAAVRVVAPARASPTATTAMPAAGSPSVRANCTASAAPCPESAVMICRPDAPNGGLGAGTASPATQQSA